MKRHICQMIAVLLLAGLATPVPAWETLKTSGGTPLRWSSDSMPVTIWLNEAGSENVPFSQVQRAVTDSYQTWTDVPTATIAFTFAGVTSQTEMENDGVNLTRWFETAFPYERDALAVTVTTYNDLTGRIIDADMNMNGTFVWSTGGEPELFDIQNVVTHEVGHVLGLGHSTVTEATMAPDARAGETSKRTLHQDDIAGVTFLYPVSGGKNPPAPQINPGDADDSGRVDGQDLTLLAVAFGTVRNQGRYNVKTDFDGDGDVDGEDLAVLAAHFGDMF